MKIASLVMVMFLVACAPKNGGESPFLPKEDELPEVELPEVVPEDEDEGGNEGGNGEGEGAPNEGGQGAPNQDAGSGNGNSGSGNEGNGSGSGDEQAPGDEAPGEEGGSGDNSGDGSDEEVFTPPPAPAACGSTLHGQNESRLSYVRSIVDFGGSCTQETQTRACNNGTFSAWSGTQNESCSVKTALQTAQDKIAENIALGYSPDFNGNVVNIATCGSAIIFETETHTSGNYTVLTSYHPAQNLTNFNVTLSSGIIPFVAPAAASNGPLAYGVHCQASHNRILYLQEGSWSVIGGDSAQNFLMFPMLDGSPVGISFMPNSTFVLSDTTLAIGNGAYYWEDYVSPMRNADFSFNFATGVLTKTADLP